MRNLKLCLESAPVEMNSFKPIPLIFLLFCSGCTTTFELTLDEVEIRKKEEIYYALNPNELIYYPPNEIFIKISFFSTLNLPELIHKEKASLGRSVELCGENVKSGIEIKDAGGIYTMDGTEIMSRPFEENFKNLTPDPQTLLYKYFVLIQVASKSVDRGYKKLPAYDLREGLHDLCIKVRGGVMYSTVYRAKTLTVPAAEIRKVFLNAKNPNASSIN